MQQNVWKRQSRETSLRQSRETILRQSRETILRQSKETILRQSRETNLRMVLWWKPAIEQNGHPHFFKFWGYFTFFFLFCELLKLILNVRHFFLVLKLWIPIQFLEARNYFIELLQNKHPLLFFGLKLQFFYHSYKTIQYVKFVKL